MPCCDGGPGQQDDLNRHLIHSCKAELICIDAGTWKFHDLALLNTLTLNTF